MLSELSTPDTVVGRAAQGSLVLLRVLPSLECSTCNSHPARSADSVVARSCRVGFS